MRRMSFALTTEQIKDKTKTVTRRQGWLFADVGMVVQPIEKGMGLQKGEKQKLIGSPIQFIHIRREPIEDITKEDLIKEGFPEMSKIEFIEMYCRANRCNPYDLCTRIEFDYLPF